ncbi:MAG: hypothetical protein PHS49_00120 [Candidatus Gracilibacteria bacterium]|nr:hypothetical protein [Candidatus Gracilibacteria bacterium]
MEYLNNSNQNSNKSIKLSLFGNIYGMGNKYFLEQIENKYNGDVKNLFAILNSTEGIYICVIQDFLSNKTHIINDKLGLYPFYYYKNGNDFRYSDDLIKLGNTINKSFLNLESILEIFQLGYITQNKTIICQINKISPGSILTFSDDKISELNYYLLTENHLNGVSEIYDAFKNGIKKRYIGEKMYSDLSGGFDSRLIMLTMVKKLKLENTIYRTNKNYDENDLEISKILANKLNLNHLIYENKDEINNEMYGFSGLCGGELLGNSLMNCWFEYENIEDCLVNKSKLIRNKKLDYGIKSFVNHVLRSEINTVQGKSWLCPINHFNSNLVFPFLDTDFLEKIVGLDTIKLKNYKTYKNIYKSNFPDFLDVKYTFNSEREGKEVSEDNFLYFKNYKLLKKDYLKLVIDNKKYFDNNYLGEFFNYKIIYKKPLETYSVLNFIQNMNNLGGIK